MNVFVSSSGRVFTIGSGFVTDVVVFFTVAAIDELDIVPVECSSKIIVVAPTNGP